MILFEMIITKSQQEQIIQNKAKNKLAVKYTHQLTSEAR